MQYHRRKRRNDHQVIQNKTEDNQGEFAPNTFNQINTTHKSSRLSSPNQQTSQNLQQQLEPSQGVEFDFSEVSLHAPKSPSSQQNPNNSRENQMNRMHSETVNSIQKKVDNYGIKNDRGQARPISNNAFVQLHKDTSAPQKLYKAQPNDRVIQRYIYERPNSQKMVNSGKAKRHLTDNGISDEVAQEVVEKYTSLRKIKDIYGLNALLIKARQIELLNQQNQNNPIVVPNPVSNPVVPNPPVDVIDDETDDEIDSDDEFENMYNPVQAPDNEFSQADLQDNPNLKHGIIRQGTSITMVASNMTLDCGGDILVFYSRDLGQGRCEVLASSNGTTKIQVDLADIDFTSEYQQVNEPLFPHDHQISSEDVKQAKLGDCYFQAALASIADKTPDHIRNMMQDNLNGSVSVRLYEVTRDEQNNPPQFTAKYFRVEKSIPRNERNEYNRGALWVKMAQKAYAVSGLSGKTTIEDTRSYQDIEGGAAYHSMEMILGQEANTITLNEKRKSKNMN